MPSYKNELYKYGILNNTNFYLSLYEQKSEFIRVKIRVRFMDAMPLSLNLL